MSNNFLISIFINNPANKNNIGIENFNPNDLNSGSVFTVSINRWYYDESEYDQNEKYVHHMFFIKSNNIYYLIHTFGTKFTYTLEELTLAELADLLGAINVNSNMDVHLKNVIMNRYFNYGVNIINDCVIRKTQPNVFTEGVNYPNVNILDYGTSDVTCFSTIFKSISLKEDFVINYVSEILEIGTVNQRYRAKKILKEYLWFKQNANILNEIKDMPVDPLFNNVIQ